MFPLGPTFSQALTPMSNNEGTGFVSESDLCVKHCTYTWIIDNYSVLCATRENFRSPPFTADGDDFKWYLEHKISKRQNKYGRTEDYVSFILLPASDHDFMKYSPVSGNLKASVINPYYNPLESEGFFSIICNGFLRYFELLFRSLSQCKNRLVTNDKLHVVCHLKYLKTNNISCAPTFLKTNNISSHNSTSSGLNPFKTIQCSLSRHLDRIRIDGDFSDMTISVKDKNYRVHKAILGARSLVFSAMFKNDMQESQKNHITVTDIDQDVFEGMLRYIYTGKTNNLEVLAYELLPVAEKYDLEDLKTMCEEVLYKKLTPDNAPKILILADMYRAKELRTQTIRYIKRNTASYKDFTNSEMYKILTTSSRPQLMLDMLAEFFNTE